MQNYAAAVVRNIPHVFRVYTRERLLAGDVEPDPVGRRVMRGFHAQRASDLFVVPEPYWIFADPKDETGTTH